MEFLWYLAIVGGPVALLIVLVMASRRGRRFSAREQRERDRATERAYHDESD